MSEHCTSLFRFCLWQLQSLLVAIWLMWDETWQCDLSEEFSSFYRCHTKVHYTGYKHHYSTCKIENVMKNVHLFFIPKLFLTSIIFLITLTKKSKNPLLLWFSLSDYLSGRMCFCDLWDCLNVLCYLWCSTLRVYCLVYACLKKKAHYFQTAVWMLWSAEWFDFYMSRLINKRWWSENNLCLWQGINCGLGSFNLFPLKPLAVFTK